MAVLVFKSVSNHFFSRICSIKCADLNSKADVCLFHSGFKIVTLRHFPKQGVLQ